MRPWPRSTGNYMETITLIAAILLLTAFQTIWAARRESMMMAQIERLQTRLLAAKGVPLVPQTAPWLGYEAPAVVAHRRDDATEAGLEAGHDSAPTAFDLGNIMTQVGGQ